MTMSWATRSVEGYNPSHTERLAAYWAEALGDPTMYSEAYGNETAAVRMHSGNGPHEDMDRRAITIFDQALMMDVRPRQRLPPPTGPARRLRVGNHDHDVPLPSLSGRGARGLRHPALVVEWTRQWNQS
jgi:hypothetical protein